MPKGPQAAPVRRGVTGYKEAEVTAGTCSTSTEGCAASPGEGQHQSLHTFLFLLLLSAGKVVAGVSEAVVIPSVCVAHSFWKAMVAHEAAVR